VFLFCHRLFFYLRGFNNFSSNNFEHMHFIAHALLAGGILIATFAGCQDGEMTRRSSGDILQTKEDSMAYAIGANINRQFQSQGISINAQMIADGYNQTMEGAGMTVEEVFGINGRVQQIFGERQGTPFSAEDPAPPLFDTLAFSLGCDLARQMQEFDIELGPPSLLAGAIAGIGAPESKLTEEQINAQMGAFQQMFIAKRQEKMNADMAKNAESGKAFLAEKAAEEGVYSTESGLLYEILRDADGPKPPSPTTKVRVHYEGRLTNGDVFDSSYERGEPTEFPLNRVIAGWTEGLQLMPVGSKFRFYIPAALGYGERGSPPKIGPNATLIFDVELLEIK
jgi:FKBP-type peptidyl-prolyl cis-trans isomerase FkpA